MAKSVSQELPYHPSVITRVLALCTRAEDELLELTWSPSLLVLLVSRDDDSDEDDGITETQFQDDPEGGPLFEAKAILKEKGSKYLVDWK
jgi:hypothetical protein